MLFYNRLNCSSSDTVLGSWTSVFPDINTLNCCYSNARRLNSCSSHIKTKPAVFRTNTHQIKLLLTENKLFCLLKSPKNMTLHWNVRRFNWIRINMVDVIIYSCLVKLTSGWRGVDGQRFSPRALAHWSLPRLGSVHSPVKSKHTPVRTDPFSRRWAGGTEGWRNTCRNELYKRTHRMRNELWLDRSCADPAHNI